MLTLTYPKLVALCANDAAAYNLKAVSTWTWSLKSRAFWIFPSFVLSFLQAQEVEHIRGKGHTAVVSTTNKRSRDFLSKITFKFLESLIKDHWGARAGGHMWMSCLSFTSDKSMLLDQEGKNWCWSSWAFINYCSDVTWSGVYHINTLPQQRWVNQGCNL